MNRRMICSASREVVSKAPDAQVMSGLDATAAHAGDSGKGGTAWLGVTASCRGGRIVRLYVARDPNLKG